MYCKETRAFGVLGQNCNLIHSSLGIAVSAGHRAPTCSIKSRIDIALPKCVTSLCLLSSTATPRSSSLYFLASSQKTSNFVFDSLCHTSRKSTNVLGSSGSIVSISHTHSSTTDSSESCESEQSPARSLYNIQRLQA